MATLQTRLQDFATRIATECKSIRTLLNGNAADNAALLTTAKGNLVAAINELKGQFDTLAESGGAVIADSDTSSTTETWSIDRIKTEISDTTAAVQAAILGGAGAAYDTLAELQALLEGDDSAIAAINTALGNRVRTDTAAQGLTSTEKSNARTNIDAYGSTEIGSPDTDFAAVFADGLD